MAKARAIVKRRKAVRNIRKITKTMQMIATAKFQKSLKRAVGTKPFTLKVRELVQELAGTIGDVDHPLLRRPEGADCSNRIALVVITSNRGLAGAYNGNVLRKATAFLREQEAAGKTVDLHVCGKKGVSYFNFQKRQMVSRQDYGDMPLYAEVEKASNKAIEEFVEKKIDALYVAYMDFRSTSVQRADVLPILPLAGVSQMTDLIARQTAEKEIQARKGIADMTHRGETETVQGGLHSEVIYDFSPAPRELLDYLLPIAVKTAFFQCFLDASTSEHVMRMVAMTSATDNADKMLKSLTMQYNRARQTQITTELSEIMGGVEAMKG